VAVKTDLTKDLCKIDIFFHTVKVPPLGVEGEVDGIVAYRRCTAGRAVLCCSDYAKRYIVNSERGFWSDDYLVTHFDKDGEGLGGMIKRSSRL
jgi:hypothetical protein